MLLFPNMSHLHIPGSVEALAGDINRACVPQGRKEQMLLFPHLIVYRNWQNQPQNKPLPECTGWRGKSFSQWKGTKGTAVPKGVRRTQTQHEKPARIIRHSRQGRTRETATHSIIPNENIIPHSQRQHDAAQSPRSGSSVEQSSAALGGLGACSFPGCQHCHPMGCTLLPGKCCNSTHWE